MENFDNDKRTSLGSSHGRILMLFQKRENATTKAQEEVNQQPEASRENQKSRYTIFIC